MFFIGSAAFALAITSGGNPSIMVLSTAITDTESKMVSESLSRLSAAGTYMSLNGLTVTVHVGGTYEFKQADSSTSFSQVTTEVHYNQGDTFTIPSPNVMYAYTYLG